MAKRRALRRKKTSGEIYEYIRKKSEKFWKEIDVEPPFELKTLKKENEFTFLIGELNAYLG